MANLMIVESPKKTKKLESILGKDWSVVASVGHIQDLPSEGGLNINKDTLELNLVLSERGKRIVGDIKKNLKYFNRVLISTDPDREGEAIARDLRDRLDLGDRYERCTFNALTKTAVLNAVNGNLGKINEDLVAAQEARRIMDRVTGWELTEAVTNYLGRLSPVGRVQSQAVNLIVQREREYNSFVQTNHFSLKSTIAGDKPWFANLDVKASGLGHLVDGGVTAWTDRAAAEELKSKISKLVVIESSKKEHESFAPAPFQTSTLHQAALNKLGFNSKKTDELAQALYQEGHITYIRTDSTEISDEAFGMLQSYAQAKGLPVLDKKRVGKKSAVAQEAHECIRPGDFEFLGETGLTADQKKLYQMIWTRTVASQLEPVVSMNTTTKLSAEIDGKTYFFKASGSVPIRKGWKVLLENDDAEDDDDADEKKKEDEDAAKNPVPVLEPGEVVDVTESILVEKRTSKPSYFTEATLSKVLEAKEIGRPSTYTAIYQKIGEKGHKYVFEDTSKSKKKPFLRPMDTAFSLIDAVSDVFKIMDMNFTSEMERGLDDIANGELDKAGFVKGFFKVIDEEIERLTNKPGAAKLEPCEKCGSRMISMPSKTPGKRWWRCNGDSCSHTAADMDGRPATEEDIRKLQEEKIKPFLNPDGTAKFPCPTVGCGKPMIRIASSKKKNTWWWACSSPRDSGCDASAFDDAENQAPVFDVPAFFAAKAEEEKKRFSNEDGSAKYPCPKCGDHLVERTSKKGNQYWCCVAPKEQCEFMTWCDENGGPVMNPEEVKAEREAAREEKMARLSNPDGSPLWACGKCGSHLDKRPTKKDPSKHWFGCTNFPRCRQTYFEGDDGKPNYDEPKGKGGGKGGKSASKKPSASKKRGGVADIYKVVGKK